MAEAGPGTLDMTVKKDSRPFVNMSCTVSADGKIMTQTSVDFATGEKTKAVYDRQ